MVLYYNTMIMTIPRKKLSDEVISWIKTYILSHELKPGDPLPTEGAMSDLMGVSRNIVREAVKALSFLGIIDSAPKRGLTVAKVNFRLATEYLGFHLAINDYPKYQLLETRIAIEIGSLSSAMRQLKADPQLCAKLEQVCVDKDFKDVDEFIAQDLAFHRGLLEAGNIGPLMAFGDLIQTFFQRFRQDVQDYRINWHKGVLEHREILTALQVGELTKAETILKGHLQDYDGVL
jgi:GntR family transcriptional regulator, transcriptional repressor for pyruvate dehydrogenase complex